MTEDDKNKVNKLFKLPEENPTAAKINLILIAVLLLIFFYGDKVGLFTNRNIDYISTNLFITENGTIGGAGAQYREEVGCDFYKYQLQAVELKLSVDSLVLEIERASLPREKLELVELENEFLTAVERNKHQNHENIKIIKLIKRQQELLEKKIDEKKKSIEFLSTVLLEKKRYNPNRERLMKTRNLIIANTKDCWDAVDGWTVIRSLVNDLKKIGSIP